MVWNNILYFALELLQWFIIIRFSIILLFSTIYLFFYFHFICKLYVCLLFIYRFIFHFTRKIPSITSTIDIEQKKLISSVFWSGHRSIYIKTQIFRLLEKPIIFLWIIFKIKGIYWIHFYPLVFRSAHKRHKFV